MGISAQLTIGYRLLASFRSNRVKYSFVCDGNNFRNTVGTIISVIRLYRASWVIGLGHFEWMSTLVRAKIKCCKSREYFGCRITDCLTTKIPSSSITGGHPQVTGNLVGRLGPTLLERCSRRNLQPQLTGKSANFNKLIQYVHLSVVS